MIPVSILSEESQKIIQHDFFPEFSNLLGKAIAEGWHVISIRLKDLPNGDSFGNYWALLEKR